MRICSYYNQNSEIPNLIPQPSDQPDLPSFELQNLTTLYETIKMIPALNNRFNSCLTIFREINEKIKELNFTVGHAAYLSSLPNEVNNWVQNRGLAFLEIQKRVRSTIIEDIVRDKLNWMNERVDFIDLYNIIPLTKPFPAFGCLPEMERTPITFSTSAYSSQFCIDNETPQNNTEVNFYGRAFNSGIAIPNVNMKVTLEFRDRKVELNAITDKNGIGHCSFKIENEPVDFEVFYYTQFYLEDGQYAGGASRRFTPHN